MRNKVWFFLEISESYDNDKIPAAFMSYNTSTPLTIRGLNRILK